jgi:GNAT superfamily N-acetyltransferase
VAATTTKTTGSRPRPPGEVAARVSALRRDVVAAAADRVEPGRWGDTVLTPSLGRVWDLNFLRLHRGPRLAPGRRLDSEAERRLGGAGLGHRKIVCEDPELGLRLLGPLEGLGWRTETLTVMTWEGGDPPATARDDAVVPATFAELEGVYRETARLAPGADRDTVNQLVAEAERARPALRLAARADGELVSFCRIFSHAGTAEIDDVGTMPTHRRRGLARAVVAAGVRWAVEGGHDLIFLRADERDWPRDFYARMGFADASRHYEFRRSG